MRRTPVQKKEPKPLPKTNYSKRYEDLKPVVDSGMTVPKYIEKLKNRLPKGEIFRRIRPQKLVDLLAAYDYELQEKARLESSQESTSDLEDNSNVPSYHHMHSSITFNDEQPNRSTSTPSSQIDCPFILYDVRDEEEYENCHIKNAKWYPKSRLSRATGQFTSEVLSYKSQPDKMIVLYCDYGELSAEAAQMFAERGFDNIFLLHGGLAEFASEFPNLVGPNAPPRPLTPSKKPSAMHSAVSGRKTPVSQRSPSRAARAVAARPGERKPWK
ncbi:centrosomal protein [Histomonas meleagridis]|uniref:centrosomal protein of 41 kDa n=1 Tax=Histomonas meleagridis TaxID=135588 RepID=UPI003559BD27|nr:centrosomal protein [Histomonas meleagridis]KAH0800949.1 centrosomal protein of 41 kDa [Histomonas meleagridis]